MIETEGIDHVSFSVRDLEASADWYQRVLGLERRHEETWDIPVMLGKGTTALALFPPGDVVGARESAAPSGPGFRHLAFRVTRENFERAQSVLDELQIGYEFQDHEISYSIYFPDPDGNRLEITTYELE